PVDVATEQTAADQFVQVLLDLVSGRMHLEHEIRDRNLSARRDDVEQLTLLIDLRHLLFFQRSLANEEYASRNEGNHNCAKQQHQAENGGSSVELVLVHCRDQPRA